MSMDTPVAILFNSDGYSLEVKDGYAYVANNSALLFAGKYGSTIKVANFDSSGNLLISGTITANNPSVSNTGAAPPSSATYVGGSVTTAAPSYTNGQMSALSLTTAGLLRVDGSAVTQPISGTITANAGTGNFTVVQSTASNLNATVTGTVAATQSGTWNINNISGTISLPTGAATESTLSSINTKTPSLGQATMSASVPVVIASNQTVIPISDNSGSLTVDNGGTFAVQAAQSGTWTVQPGNTANTTPWLATINQGGNSATVTASNALKVDGSAVTQPVSGTVSITANSSVNLNQIGGNAVNVGNGTAGTGTIRVAIASDNTAFTVNSAQSGTWNINNISGTISLPTGAATEASLAKLTLTQGSTTSGQSGSLIQGAVTTAAPTYTTGQTNPLSLTTSGAVRIDLGATSANSTAIKVDGSAVTQPVSGTVSITANSSINLNQIAGTSTSTGNGTANAGTQRVTIASDNTAFTVNAAQSGTWSVRSQDGYGNALSSSTSAPVGTETGLVVRNIPSGTQVVSGTVSVNGTQADNTSNSSSKLPVIAALANTSAPTWTNDNMVPLSVDTSGALRITGSITANNASVSSTGASPPASATYVGGSVTTTAPTYTNGQMNALSLTTSGALRIDNQSGSSTSSVTSVASSATNVTLLSANTSRVSAMVYNDSNQKMYLKFGATASITSFTVLIAAGGYYEFPLPIWRGQVDALWASANGSARITELT